MEQTIEWIELQPGGNPARVIKKRFSEDIIEMLLELKWWDWEVVYNCLCKCF